MSRYVKKVLRDHAKKENEKKKKKEEAWGDEFLSYSVPAIPVLTWDLSGATHLASPKSAIFGLRFSSSSMLLPFMSLWIIFTSEPPWRYASPSAVPTMISNRCCQLRPWVPSLPARNEGSYPFQNAVVEQWTFGVTHTILGIEELYIFRLKER